MKYISDNKEEDMKKSIDFYIESRPTLLKAMDLERSATSEMYNKLSYKGD